MEDGLAGRGADIDANVVTVWLIEAVDDLFGPFNRRQKGRPFSLRGLEPVGDVPSGNQKGMAAVDGKCVPQPVDERVGEKKAVWIGTAEAARRRAQDVRTWTTITLSRPSRPSLTHRAQRQR
jgi:hypothetical protein